MVNLTLKHERLLTNVILLFYYFTIFFNSKFLKFKKNRVKFLKYLILLLKKMQKCVILHICREKTKKTKKKLKKTPYMKNYMFFHNNLEFSVSIY